MFKFTQLGNEAQQAVTMVLNENIEIPFTFEYKPNQLGWFFGFTYNGETYSNIRLTTCYNILRAYRNWLPFGLRCDTSDGGEPLNIDDFSSGYASVYLLNKEDVKAVEANFYAKI